MVYFDGSIVAHSNVLDPVQTYSSQAECEQQLISFNSGFLENGGEIEVIDNKITIKLSDNKGSIRVQNCIKAYK